MTLEYFDEVIKELRKYIADKNIQICLMTLVSVCELIIGVTDLVNEKIVFGVAGCILAVIGFVFTAFLFEDISKKMERKIEFLKNMYDIDQRYKRLEKEALEEQIKEQENGSTKECKCELEQNNTVS